jgi:hypothetical protein
MFVISFSLMFLALVGALIFCWFSLMMADCGSDQSCAFIN